MKNHYKIKMNKMMNINNLKLKLNNNQMKNKILMNPEKK